MMFCHSERSEESVVEIIQDLPEAQVTIKLYWR